MPINAYLLAVRSLMGSWGINNPRVHALVTRVFTAAAAQKMSFAFNVTDRPEAEDAVILAISGMINGKPYSGSITFPRELLE